MKKRLLTCLIASTICLVACEQPNQSSSPVITNQLKSIEILKDTVAVEELEVIVEDTFTLNYSTNNESTIAITWESSNPNIVSIILKIININTGISPQIATLSKVYSIPNAFVAFVIILPM